MTNEELLRAVGHVDEDILENCESVKPARWKARIAAAAALFACVIIGAAVARPGAQPMPTDPEPTQPKWECFMLSGMNGASPPLGLAASDAAAVWNRGTYQDENAPREMTITFDGITYTGYYRNSICAVGCGKIKDYYQSEGPDAAFSEFSVERETGILTGIDFVTRDYFDANEATEPLEDPINMLPDMARQWASHFIDVDQYKMRLASTRVMQEPRTVLYVYEFVKEVDGRSTTDKLQMLITDRGILGWIGSWQLGWVEDNRDQLEAFACVDAKALIQRDTNYTGVAVSKESYGITPEGKAVMLVSCSVKVQGSMTAGAILVIENTAQ